MERNPWLRALIILGVILISVQLFSVVWNFGREYGDIILVFFLAWMLAFLLNPVVEFLTMGQRRPRWLAVAGVYLGLLAILIVMGLLIIPPTANQVSALGRKIPQYTSNTSHLVDDLQERLNSRGLNVNLHQAATVRDFNQAGQQLGSYLAAHALTLAQGVLAAVFDGVIVIVLSFYMMLDAPRITRSVIQVTPGRFRADMQLLFASIDHSFGGYLRASFVIALVYAIGTALAMYILGVPFVLPVSAFAGLMLVVPIVGDIVAVLPPLLLGLFTISLVRIIILLVVMVALQQVVLQILRPKIMGRSVGLHPLWVLGAFLVGARAAGIWGALFSVPIAAIGQTIVQLYYFRAAGKTSSESQLARSLRGNHTSSPRTADGPPEAVWPLPDAMAETREHEAPTR
jgi:predicted PurR-regulated permease PerM